MFQLFVEMRDVQFLLVGLRPIAAVSQANSQMDSIVLNIFLLKQMVQGLELVITPTFSDLKSGTVLPFDCQLGMNRVYELDTVFVLVLTHQTFGHLHEH